MPLTRGFDNLFIAADDDFAGRRALQRAGEIRPDVVHLKFANGAYLGDKFFWPILESAEQLGAPIYLPSRFVRYLVAIEGKADMSRTSAKDRV